jgi:hypothetical protein
MDALSPCPHQSGAHEFDHLGDGEAVREHDRLGAAVAGCGEQFERAAAGGGRDALAVWHRWRNSLPTGRRRLGREPVATWHQCHRICRVGVNLSIEDFERAFKKIAPSKHGKA